MTSLMMDDDDFTKKQTKTKRNITAHTPHVDCKPVQGPFADCKEP
jgi:hypothetical protein